MKISVIISTYLHERLNDFLELSESISKQTYKDIEKIVVVDGNYELYAEIKSHMHSLGNNDVKVLYNEKKSGLASSRNAGIKNASGNIVAFIDDDAVAAKDWIERLVSVYRDSNVIGVGGKILPLWMSSEPNCLPEELYWIIGATYKGFPEYMTKVRNLFGSNMSFKREVFEKVGSFDENLGRKGESQLQAEEAEFCIRVSRRLGKVVYTPEAIVYHKVFSNRTRFGYIIKRAFWQGYSKAAINSRYKSDVLSTESDYLKQLLFKFYPSAVKKLKVQPLTTLKQVLVVSLVVVAVSSGYMYYFMRGS